MRIANPYNSPCWIANPAQRLPHNAETSARTGCEILHLYHVILIYRTPIILTSRGWLFDDEFLGGGALRGGEGEEVGAGREVAEGDVGLLRDG